MDKIFPYTNAKRLLVELFQEALPDELKSKSASILDLHLRDDTLAMPKMSPDQLQHIRTKFVDGSSLDDICKELDLEKTNTKKGMLRVLARTHLNRSGMNHVSMGHFEKTLSPRILNFIDTIDIEKDINGIQSEIIKNWICFAERHRKNESSKDGLNYDDKAFHALTVLGANSDRIVQDLSENNITAHKLSVELNIDIGWCRIVLGIMSGLNFLFLRKWDLFEQVSHTDLRYKEIHKLIKECQENVCEYGYALAGSFLADLGGHSFVKDDTHVQACMNAISAKFDTSEKRVKTVIESAHKIKIQPRILDKIMYLAGSGNLYLIGLKLPGSQSIKKRFVEELPNLL